jgi:hypothetical protein
MAFVAITTAESDAKSPIDDLILAKIKDNFDDLNARVVVAGAAPLNIEVIGKLSFLNTYPQKRSHGMTVLSKEFTPSVCRYSLKKSGTGGTLTFDLRKVTSPKTPITGIDYQYSGATTSIAKAGSSLNTQSIARATTQIATQSITHAKAAKNIQSIISLGAVLDLGTNVFQINLSAAIDSDTSIGDPIVIAGATSGGNNGTFTITDKNRAGGNNICVENASGVAQTGAVGTAQEKIMSYNFVNPVSTLFGTGHYHIFAAHTGAANDGTLLVFKINQSGNNIWVKNSAGVAQGGIAGTVDTSYWTFALSSAASSTDYVAGEAAVTAAHSSAGNNSATGLLIILVNSGGNNLILYNTAGVVQGGVAGTINTNRWVYAMPTDPSTQVTAGDTFNFLAHTNSANNGVFTIKEVNRSGANNLVIYNISGVAQGGAVGAAFSVKKLVKFSTNQSANYTVLSFIEMAALVDSTYNANDTIVPFQVLEINRGGGANYNLVIESTSGASQASPAGYIKTEMKSLFTSAPIISADLTSLEPNQNQSSSATNLVATAVPANTPILLFITNAMTGDPQDLSVSLL